MSAAMEPVKDDTPNIRVRSGVNRTMDTAGSPSCLPRVAASLTMPSSSSCALSPLPTASPTRSRSRFQLMPLPAVTTVGAIFDSFG